MVKNIMCLTLLLSGFAASAMAADSNVESGNRQRPEQGQQRRDPPPKAFEACKGKKAGDSLQITLPSGENISATCTASDKGLFARPEHPQGKQGSMENREQRQGGDQEGQGQHREPPARAFEKCKGKSEGDNVQITLPSGEELSAKCVSSPKGLFARPDHPPRMRKDGETAGDDDRQGKEGY